MIIIGTYKYSTATEDGQYEKVFVDTEYMGGDEYHHCLACDYNDFEKINCFLDYEAYQFAIDPGDYDWAPDPREYISLGDCQKKEANAWHEGVQHFQERYIE